MRRLALALIHAYQRWISPHKGFTCAHRVHLGGPSCSTVGARLIRRFGLVDAWPLLRLRLRRCGEVHRAHQAPNFRPWAAQRGDCDLPCDGPCDGDTDTGGGRRIGRVLECGCDACDLFDWGRERKRERKHDGKPSKRSPRRMA